MAERSGPRSTPDGVGQAASAERQGSEMARLRKKIVKGPAEDLLQDGTLVSVIRDSLNARGIGLVGTEPLSTGSDTLELLGCAFRRLAVILAAPSEQIKDQAERIVRDTLLQTLESPESSASPFSTSTSSTRGPLEVLAHLIYAGLDNTKHADRNLHSRSLDLLTATITLSQALGKCELLQPLSSLALRALTNGASPRDAGLIMDKRDWVVLASCVDLLLQEPETARRVPVSLAEATLFGLGSAENVALRIKLGLKLLNDPQFVAQLASHNAKLPSSSSSPRTIGQSTNEKIVPSDASTAPQSSMNDLSINDERSTEFLDALEPFLYDASVVQLFLPKMTNLDSATAARLLSRVKHDHASWIRCLAAFAHNRIIKADDIDEDRLISLMGHVNDSVRLACFETIIGLVGPKAEDFSPKLMSWIKEWLRWNMRVYDSGFRYTFRIYLSKLVDACERLRSSSVKAQGRYKQGSSSDQDQQKVHQIDAFFDELVEEFVQPSLQVPRYTSHPRIIQGLGLLFQILRYRDASAATPKLTDLLLGCLTSEYSDVRKAANSIMHLKSPSPLPGYETEQSFVTLCEAARKRMRGCRQTDAEAGALAYSILFAKNALSSEGALDSAVRIVQGLLNDLSSSLDVIEKDLAGGLESEAMHGLLLGLALCVDRIAVKTPSNTRFWVPYFKQIRPLVERLWRSCRQILVQGEDQDTEDHEIARAYGALDDLDDSSADDAHLILLSNCWRAMKEASHLLLEVHVIETDDGRPLLPYDDYEAVGAQWIEWLHTVRHRGLFSKMAEDFGVYVRDLKINKSLSGNSQGHDILQREIDAIASQSISTTRRSAALPFCILALVLQDDTLFSVAYDRLSDLVRTGNREVAVHALNIIRVIMTDAKQANLAAPYVAASMKLALERFSSNYWDVANAALLLFSVLFKGLFGKRLNDPSSSISKPLFLDSFERLHPGLLNMLLTDLESSKVSEAARSANFLLLVGLKHMTGTAGVQDELRQRLLRYATQFLSEPNWTSPSQTDMNFRHGLLMLINAHNQAATSSLRFDLKNLQITPMTGESALLQSFMGPEDRLSNQKEMVNTQDSYPGFDLVMLSGNLRQRGDASSSDQVVDGSTQAIDKLPPDFAHIFERSTPAQRISILSGLGPVMSQYMTQCSTPEPAAARRWQTSPSTPIKFDSTSLVVDLVEADPFRLSSQILAAIETVTGRTLRRILVCFKSAIVPKFDPITAWTHVQTFLGTVYAQAAQAAASSGRPLLNIDVWIDGLTLKDWKSNGVYERVLASDQVYILGSKTKFSIPVDVSRLTHLESENTQSQDDTSPISHPAHSSDLGANGRYPAVALGGTFDHLHAGHKVLLSMGLYVASRKLIVGVSDDPLLVSKSNHHLLEPISTRILRVESFLRLLDPDIEYHIVPILDVYGPTGTDPDIQCLVVSKESEAGGLMVDKERTSKLLPALDRLIIDVIASDNNTASLRSEQDPTKLKTLKMGSTFIREWIQNRFGLVKQALSLLSRCLRDSEPQDMRLTAMECLSRLCNPRAISDSVIGLQVLSLLLRAIEDDDAGVRQLAGAAASRILQANFELHDENAEQQLRQLVRTEFRHDAEWHSEVALACESVEILDILRQASADGGEELFASERDNLHREPLNQQSALQEDLKHLPTEVRAVISRMSPVLRARGSLLAEVENSAGVQTPLGRQHQETYIARRQLGVLKF